jgi:uncharacterized membrane protein
LTIVFRESSFGAAGLILSANAKNGWSKATRKAMIAAGSILIALAALVFGVQHFLHPLGLPGVPLQKEMPAWVPARALIDYATGAALLAAGASILLNWKRRTVTASVGGWLLLLVLAIYTPVMLGALANPALGVKVEGINYFFDTLLFAGVMLAAGSSSVD